MIPLLMVRLVFTVGVATTVGTGHTQVFNPITGSWVLFLVLAFLPEVFVSVTYVTMGMLQPMWE
jgi:hypothetical protein